MKIDVKVISTIIGIVVTLGGLLWALSGKFNEADIRLTSIETKLDMLLEERLIKMERNELYRRMEKSLKTKPSEIIE